MSTPRLGSGNLSLVVAPPPVASDEELVAAAGRGDRDAVAAIWHRYASLARYVLRSTVGFHEDVEDLLQEVFEGFLRWPGRVRDGKSLRSYLMGIAFRRGAMAMRSRRVRRWVTLSRTGVMPDGTSPPVDFEGRDTLLAIMRALEKVNERARVAYILHHVEGFENWEVADALRVSLSTAKRSISEGREAVYVLAVRDPALSSSERKQGREAGDNNEWRGKR